MMDVWIVRVPMHQRLMAMPMLMRFVAGPVEVMVVWL